MKSIYSKARLARDKNFDNKFFVGVKTTGIVCRPSCPARTALEKNVVYFDTIYEALEQKFRPCLRCRPDIHLDDNSCSAVGTTIVKNALNHIYSGYLNNNSVEDLALELGVSDRHLRKLFVDSLGAPPLKIALYHKSIFAKKMLLSTNRSVTEIAYASGFGSLRQFNDIFKKIFGSTPSNIRKDCPGNSNQNGATALQLRYQKPFNFFQVLSFLKLRAMAGVELVTGTSFSRTFRIDGARGFFSVVDNPEQSCLELNIECDDIKCYMPICNRVRRMFDINTNFEDINKQLGTDSRLALGMTNGHVPRLSMAFNPFEFVVRAILGQQITVKAATTLASRIALQAGIKTGSDFPDGLDCYFPDATEILNIDLDGLGITKNRQTTIRTAAEGIRSGQVKLNCDQSIEDFQTSFKALKGIGEWTTDYVAMRGLGIIDAFPAGDLGIIKGLSNDEGTLARSKILHISESWRPYRAYAALCIWNLKSGAEE